MIKKIFELSPAENKKSVSVKEATDYFVPRLAPYKTKSIQDRPTIIIDNGSFECRAGWSFDEDPFLRFRNQVAKPKTSVNRQIDAMHLVGDEINEFEASKVARRSMFDKNVVYHTQSLEHTLDYIFSHLGLANGAQIEYPLLMTEAMCNPNYSRALVSELIFECYHVPALSYCVDSLLSFHYNTSQLNGCDTPARSGLIIDSSHATTHLIPVFDQKWQVPLTKRLQLGGHHHNDLLTRSLALKYPQHKNQLTPEVVQELQEKYTCTAQNYREQIQFLEAHYLLEKEVEKKEEEARRERLLRGTNDSQRESDIKPKEFPTHMPHKVYKNRTQLLIDRLNEGRDMADIFTEDKILQLSWQPETLPTSDELKKRQEMRKEQGQKLKELMARKRAEKKKNMENEYADLSSLQSIREAGDQQSFKEELESRGLSNLDAYQKRVKFLAVKLGLQKEESKQEQADKYALLDIADEFLKPEEVKQKRIQKMHKTAQEMREKRKLQAEKDKKRIEELKTQDKDQYLANLYEQRRLILDKLTKRAKQREEIAKRGSKTAQRRMQTIASLAIEDKTEKRRATRGAVANPNDQQQQPEREDGNDDFGMEDGDWDVYREIAKDGFSEDEEEDQSNLADLEDKISDLDPKFQMLMYSTSKMPTAEDFQIRLWTDTYRGTEILYQPSIVGLESEGLSEILEHMLGYFGRAGPRFRPQINPEDDASILGRDYRSELMSYVLLTGGNTKVPNFDNRMKQELRMLNPPELPINVVNSCDPMLDAWRGGAMLARDNFSGGSLKDFSISKAQYEECGHHYLKEHFCSNFLYGQRPVSVQTPKTEFVCEAYKRARLV